MRQRQLRMRKVRVTIGGAVYELVYKLPLLDLPQDLLLQVLYHCDYVGLCRMATTCRAVRDLEARERDALWSCMLLKYYGDYIFSGVLASSTQIEPLGLFKEMKHRDTVEDFYLPLPVVSYTVAQLNERYEFFFEIHLFNGRKDNPVLQAPAVLVPPGNDDEEDFSLATVDGWAAPEGWSHVAYDDLDGIEWVQVFAKHTASNTIARIAHLFFDEEGAGSDGCFFTGGEVWHPWHFVAHGGPKGNARAAIGAVPFRTFVSVGYRDEDETKWTDIRFSGFRTRCDDDDDAEYITPGRFEHELLRSPHLKWHPGKPAEC